MFGSLKDFKFSALGRLPALQIVGLTLDFHAERFTGTLQRTLATIRKIYKPISITHKI